MDYIFTNNIDDVRSYYKRKYKKIFDALESKNANNFKIDTSCYQYLEVKCEIHGRYFRVNVGINNKYNTWFKTNYNGVKRNAFITMREVAEYIKTL